MKALKGGRNLGVLSAYSLRQLGVALLPALIFGAALLLSWHVNTAAPDADAVAASARSDATTASDAAGGGLQAPPGSVAQPPAIESALAEPPKSDGGGLADPLGAEAIAASAPAGAAPAGVQAPPVASAPAAAAARSAPTCGWWTGSGVGLLALLGFYAILSFQRLGIFKLLLSSFCPLVLILAVLGSIMMGLATPIEAAAVGAFGGVLLVALNLQTASLSPPVAMAAFYLQGVSPPHVTLKQIYSGRLAFMGIPVLAIVRLCLFPASALWLPQLLYSR